MENNLSTFRTGFQKSHWTQDYLIAILENRKTVKKKTNFFVIFMELSSSESNKSSEFLRQFFQTTAKLLSTKPTCKFWW